jgi:hypothetical protein
MTTSPKDARLEGVDDYTAGIMTDDEAAAFEETLFADAASGHAATAHALAFTGRLARAITRLHDRPGISIPVRKETFEELRRTTPNVAYFDVHAGGVTQVPTWPASTELVFYRVGVDLRGFDEADVVVTSTEGAPIKVFRDVQWDPSDGALYAVCDEPLARMSFGLGFLARVEAVKDGRRETVARLELLAPVPRDR